MMMSQNPIEPLRRTQSAGGMSHSNSSHSHAVGASPLRAPALMLVTGSGEIRSLPSPIVGGGSDNESLTSEDEMTYNHNHSKTLSAPSVFDSHANHTGPRT